MPSSQPTRCPTPAACGAPTPIEVAEGVAPASADGRLPAAESSTAATDSMTMLAPVELVLGDVGELPATTTGYVFPAGATVSAETVAALAAVLGVEGEPVPGSTENGMAWQVGPTDGTTPSLTVSAARHCRGGTRRPGCSRWTRRRACRRQRFRPHARTGVSPGPIEPCPAPEPPAGVPTAAEAEERARQLARRARRGS